METVDGELDYQVYVKCPECDLPIDLVDQDDDHLLANCVFGNGSCRANWKDTGLTFICPECNIEFELGNIEY